jgi:hypothetical protein
VRPVRKTGDCGRCARTGLTVHVPTKGDGTVYWTYWHRDDTGAWCRSELDMELVRFDVEARPSAHSPVRSG